MKPRVILLALCWGVIVSVGVLTISKLDHRKPQHYTYLFVWVNGENTGNETITSFQPIDMAYFRQWWTNKEVSCGTNKFAILNILEIEPALIHK